LYFCTRKASEVSAHNTLRITLVCAGMLRQYLYFCASKSSNLSTIYIYIHTYIYVYICMYTYTYIYIYMFMYITAQHTPHDVGVRCFSKKQATCAQTLVPRRSAAAGSSAFCVRMCTFVPMQAEAEYLEAVLPRERRERLHTARRHARPLSISLHPTLPSRAI
jgi:hypothetical protein